MWTPRRVCSTVVWAAVLQIVVACQEPVGRCPVPAKHLVQVGATALLVDMSFRPEYDTWGQNLEDRLTTPVNGICPRQRPPVAVEALIFRRDSGEGLPQNLPELSQIMIDDRPRIFSRGDVETKSSVRGTPYRLSCFGKIPKKICRLEVARPNGLYAHAYFSGFEKKEDPHATTISNIEQFLDEMDTGYRK